LLIDLSGSVQSVTDVFNISSPTDTSFKTLCQPIRSDNEGATLTPEQEVQLQHLETELAIADKQLRLGQVRKQIAETELDIVGLQQTLQQQLEGTAVPQL
jgi:hypothetical protein